MMTTKYKGFNILARPYLLHKSNRWAAELEISRADTTQSFGVAARYGTEEEANARCSGLGRRIIDGEIPGWSVDRLRSASRERMRKASRDRITRSASRDRLTFISLPNSGTWRPLIIAGILIAALGTLFLASIR